MAAEHAAATAHGRDVLARHEVLTSAGATGVVAGLAMLAVVTIGAASQGLSPLLPARVLGETLVGPEALEGAARVAYGVAIHLATSVAMAFLFAGVVPRDFPSASAIGVGVGFTLLVFMFILMPVVVPWTTPGFRDGMQGIGGTWIVGLGVFGCVLGAGPALRRWVGRERLAPSSGAAVGPGTTDGARSSVRAS